MAGGAPQQCSARPLPDPSHCPLAPQIPICTRPEEHKRHNDSQEPKLETPKEQSPCLDSTQGCPSRAFHPSAKAQKPSPQVTFGLWALLPRGETLYWMQKKSSCGSIPIMQDLGEEPKNKKGI